MKTSSIKNVLVAFSTLIMLFAVASVVAQDESKSEEAGPALQFKLKSIDGEEVNLADYQGKVVVMVNVASKCGLTPQYSALQDLHEELSEDGLAILGIPCNQFGGQEPGSEAEIKQFCKTNYGVDFDMFAKIEVNGDDRHPLYTYLTSQEIGPAESGDIKRNFEKFVVGRDGKVIARFGPRVKPDSDEFLEVIGRALKTN